MKEEAESKRGTSHLVYKITFYTSYFEAKSLPSWIRRNLVTTCELSVNLPVTLCIFFPFITLLKGFLTSFSESSAMSTKPWRNWNRFIQLQIRSQHLHALLGLLFFQPGISRIVNAQWKKQKQLLTSLLSLRSGSWMCREYWLYFPEKPGFTFFFHDYHPSSM